MRIFSYTIQSPVGLHARHAGLLVKQASQFQSDVTVSFGSRDADAKRIYGLMNLGIHQGDVITITVQGEDEELAASRLKAFLFANF